jgi:hypothetical protein
MKKLSFGTFVVAEKKLESMNNGGSHWILGLEIEYTRERS